VYACVGARARARFKWVFVTINHPSLCTSPSLLGYCCELIPRPIKAVYAKVPCEVTPESWNRTPSVTLYKKNIILSGLWWSFFANALSFNQITSLQSYTAIVQTFVNLFLLVVDAELIHKNSTSHKVTLTLMTAIKHRKMLHAAIFLQLYITACSSNGMILQKQKRALRVMFNAYKISPLHATNVLFVKCTYTEPDKFNPHPATHTTFTVLPASILLS
jgi:hypothetical protein